jgi:molybdopterin converting factor small subunit
VPTFPVAIPSVLRSYTGGAARVEARVDAPEPRLRDVFAALDAAYPGIRFRMVDEAGKVRPHIQVFVGMAVQRDPDTILKPGDEIMLVGALSGG